MLIYGAVKNKIPKLLTLNFSSKNFAPRISTKEEIYSGTIFKGLSIIFVIILHLLSLYPATIYTSGGNHLFFIGINQFARFSVPLFLAASGFGLARKYQQQVVNGRELLWQRIVKLMPLYLLWSLILIGFLYIGGSWDTGKELRLFERLLDGSVDYHLYFVPIIFQFYLLFAVVLSKIRSKRQLGFLVLVSAVLQLAWFVYLRLFLEEKVPGGRGILSDQLQYRQLISWAFYFLIGVFAARFSLEKIRKNWIIAIFLLVLTFTSLIWSIQESASLITSGVSLVYATSFVRVPVFIYASAFSLLAIIYGPLLLLTRKKWHNLASIFGKYSYIIYLSHTLFLRIFDELIINETHSGTAVVALVVLVYGVAFSVKRLS